MPAEPKATLEQLLKHLGFEATIEEKPWDDGLLLDVKAEDSGRLIGRQGQALRDLQYLLNRMVYHGSHEGPRLTVDVGGYRQQQQEELVKRTKDAADKVRRWGDIIELEPMNSFDRRVVHHTLKDDPEVETQSVEVEGTSKKAILIRPRRK
jgi:spoIIIJ-associated protein